MSKIAVYAICKNEESNISAWIDSVKEADYIIVGDTGSSDNSIELLKKHGVNVYEINIVPWRFDVARNEIMKRIPLDVDWCISLDFDERLEEGFINNLKKEDVGKYNCITNTIIEKDSDDYIKTKFIINRIHSRNNYLWENAVHEKLVYIGSEKKKKKHNEKLIIYHYPDIKKDRSHYLKLLEIAHTDNKNSFLFHYHLGKEYLKQGKIEKGLQTFLEINQQYLDDDQKSALLRMIARSYYLSGKLSNSYSILLENIDKYPHCSSNYIELYTMLYEQKKYNEIIKNAFLINKIDFNYKSIYNDYLHQEWIIYDLLAMAYFFLNDNDSALFFSKKAYSLNPGNYRIKNNISYYEEERKKKNE